jgi:hypothetical protein
VQADLAMPARISRRRAGSIQGVPPAHRGSRKRYRSDGGRARAAEHSSARRLAGGLRTSRAPSAAAPSASSSPSATPPHSRVSQPPCGLPVRRRRFANKRNGVPTYLGRGQAFGFRFSTIVEESPESVLRVFYEAWKKPKTEGLTPTVDWRSCARRTTTDRAGETHPRQGGRR